MSLVGTRPILPGELEQYELHHRTRIAIKPGITGMWQVSGRSDITDFEKVVELDRKYIENWNLGLDVKILLQTVRTVLKGEGRCESYGKCSIQKDEKSVFEASTYTTFRTLTQSRCWLSVIPRASLSLTL